MHIVDFIAEAAPVQRLLNHIGEPAEPSRITPAREPPAWDDQPVEAIAELGRPGPTATRVRFDQQLK